MQRQAIMGCNDITVGDLVKEWISVYSPAWTSEKYRYTVLYRLELVTTQLEKIKANDVNSALIANEINNSPR